MTHLTKELKHKLADLEAYCEFGLVDDALRTWKSLPAEAQQNFDALSLFTSFLFNHGRYTECFFHAMFGVVVHPGQTLWWIVGGKCLRAMKRTADCDQLLRVARDRCPEAATALELAILAQEPDL